MATKVEQISQEHPDCDVEVWAMDEHRVGLKPVIRRIWVDEWTVPIANVNWRFKWLWLYGFVHPQSGQTYWWILPYVNIQLFNRVLEDFARHFDIGTHKQVVLVVDQAGWQKARPSRSTTGYTFRIFAFPLPRITASRAFMDTDRMNQSRIEILKISMRLRRR